MKEIRLPLNEETVLELKAGDNVLLNGSIYVARDAAHKKLVELINQGQVLPFDIKGQTIYYMGPSPARPGQVIGAAGPTTSGRMDSFTVALLEIGLKGMIGKGSRSPAIKEAMRKYHAIYFGAIGGAGALISRTIRRSETIAFAELGAEAIRCLEVDHFPATVINDVYGGDLYEDGQRRFRR
jgi:fumarate hydratase subunit beta